MASSIRQTQPWLQRSDIEIHLVLHSRIEGFFWLLNCAVRVKPEVRVIQVDLVGHNGDVGHPLVAGVQ